MEVYRLWASLSGLVVIRLGLGIGRIYLGFSFLGFRYPLHGRERLQGRGWEEGGNERLWLNKGD